MYIYCTLIHYAYTIHIYSIYIYYDLFLVIPLVLNDVLVPVVPALEVVVGLVRVAVRLFRVTAAVAGVVVVPVPLVELYLVREPVVAVPTLRPFMVGLLTCVADAGVLVKVVVPAVVVPVEVGGRGRLMKGAKPTFSLYKFRISGTTCAYI